jgi:hypothetical protein
MRIVLLLVLFFGLTAFAQDPEIGRVERIGDRATVIVDSPRTVDSAAITLAEKFGIRVNVEDPVSPDVLKVSHLEISFATGPGGMSGDIPGVVRQLAENANAQFPFNYRLDVDGNWFTLVPTRTRARSGNAIEATPLMDRRITIPPGTRTIAETANLMAEALSAQTGLRVSCCQSFVAGIPWGMAAITLEARDEPARNVLKRLITEAAVNQPDRDYWLVRCDPLPSAWCFINLQPIDLETETKQPRPNRPGKSGGSNKWFDHAPSGH